MHSDNYQTVSLIDQQHALEAESMALGIEKYQAALQAGEDTLPPGMRLIKAAVEPLSKAIIEAITEAQEGKASRSAGILKFLQQFTPERAAFITARRVIHGVASREPLARLAMSLAQEMENCINYDKLEAEEPRLYKQLIQKIKRRTDEGRRAVIMRTQQNFARVETIKWGHSEKARLGVVLIEMMAATTGLIELVKVSKGKNNTPIMVTATATTLMWLEKAHARCEILQPSYMPMVVPPRRWESPYEGGYLTKDLSFPLMKTANKNYLEEMTHWHMPDVYGAINALQETGWSINQGVLRVAREVWDGGGRLGKLPVRDPLPLPPQGYNPELDPVRHQEWKRTAAKVYDENVRLISKRLAVQSKLYLAEKFSPFKAIYFPHAMDWRGRVYPVSSMLNPQGDDLAKGLLQFAEGKALGETGGYWLAVHGANCFGVDKVSFEERVKWVKENHELILESALNPLDGHRFWTEADSPYCFLAFCFEWMGYSLQGESYVSYLPVSWDGTCNGLQNFSAMLRDEVGGKAVNLVPSDKPSDIYSEVAKVSQRLIDAEDTEQSSRWAKGMNRRLAKRNTMTVPYGVSHYGMREQLRQEFQKMVDDGEQLPVGTDIWEDAAYIAGKNYEAIGEVVVAAREAMDWLQETAKVVAKNGLPIRWVTPAGLPVLQHYRVTEGKHLDFSVGGRRFRLTINITGHKLDGRKQSAGISPNFVHSLDAAHMMRTVNYCTQAGIRSFAMIHDSYGTHAADAQELAYQLRKAFVDQYSGDVLNDFRDQLIAQIPEEMANKIPPCPLMGTLELAEVMNSEYFFA